MHATLVHAIIHPDRIPEAAMAVEEELVPAFLDRPGARHGYWMVHRPSGRLWTLGIWDDADDMWAAAASEAALRSVVADRVGARTLAVHSFEVAGAHEEPIDQSPRVRWVRATWVAGVHPDLHGALPALFREAVPDQARTSGFCASYWLADPTSGAGLGLSFWEGPAEVRRSEALSRARRRRFERVLGCRVVSVRELAALGVATASVRPVGVAPIEPELADADLTHLGTAVARPPGTLLAVPGERADEVVIIVDGRAAVVTPGGLRHLDAGSHLGGRRIGERRSHDHAVVTVSPVHVNVISRPEFVALRHDRPDVVRRLVDDDAEPGPES